MSIYQDGLLHENEIKVCKRTSFRPAVRDVDVADKRVGRRAAPSLSSSEQSCMILCATSAASPAVSSMSFSTWALGSLILIRNVPSLAPVTVAAAQALLGRLDTSDADRRARRRLSSRSLAPNLPSSPDQALRLPPEPAQ